MDQHMLQITLGATTIALIDCGALHVRLANWLRLAETDWPPTDHALFAQPISVPVQCVHMALPGRSVLVDPCHPELLSYVGDLVPGAAPRPSLLTQLASIGVDPATVDTVILTHPHFDHYCGIIAPGASAADDRLLFPNARHLLSQADWAGVQAALKSPASPESRALGLAQRHGLLEPIAGWADLGDGISTVPTPGETPGHQAVRVESAGKVLYLLGDLYHHPVEVAHPEWMVHWADPATTVQSRSFITTTALAEEALVIASHISGVGRLEQIAGVLRWVSFST